MASESDNSERRLVPRWRYARRIVHTAEYGSDPRIATLRPPQLTLPNDVVGNWRRNPSISTAADMVSTAIDYGLPEVARDAADFLLTKPSRTTPGVVALASAVVREERTGTTDPKGHAITAEPSIKEAQRVIQEMRKRLAVSPRNVSDRLDLSLAFTVLGHADKAWDQMRVALLLAPNHRNVLRAAVRLLIHLGRIDLGRIEEAYKLVRHHPRTMQDPWMMSQEIVLASILERPVKLAVRAKRLIEDLQHAPAFITELTSATGMLELQAGNHKRGRKLLQRSLADPTDNVVAQAQWVKQHDRSIEVPTAVLQRPGNMEANYFRAMYETRWKEALTHADAWAMDEPFSSRPAIAGSFLSLSVFDDPARAIQFAELGLRADGADQLLRNNYVVALVRAGQLDKARSEFQKIRYPLQPFYPEYTFLATKGLLIFAGGSLEEGRKLYMQALQSAAARERQLVLINWIDTESRYSPKHADAMIREAREALESSNDPIISAMTAAVVRRHRSRSLADIVEAVSGVPVKLARFLKK